MKLKFLKDTVVDVMDTDDDVYQKSFRQNDLVNTWDSSMEDWPSSYFVNILLVNGEILLDVPKDRVTVVS